MLLARLRRAGDPDSRHEHHGRNREHSGGEEHGSDSREGDEQPTERRPDEEAHAFDRARDRVRGDELGGRADQRRCERDLRRAEERLGDDGEHGERVHHGPRRVERHEHGCRRQHGAAHEIARNQDGAARPAVGEYREPRRHDRGHAEPNERHDPDSRDAVVLERVHGDGDGRRAAGEVRGRPGELEPPHVRVAKDRTEDANRLEEATRCVHGGEHRTLVPRPGGEEDQRTDSRHVDK
jgi:hypothetical protein